MNRSNAYNGAISGRLRSTIAVVAAEARPRAACWSSPDPLFCYRRRKITDWTVLALLLPVLVACGATRYVWLESPRPGQPFTTWSTAAHSIQEAVDAALAHDTVLVTNGLYATGGRAVQGEMTNRVVIDKPLTVQTVNGPAMTLILGASAPGGGNGDGAVRCVYLGGDAVLSGFTLTNGHTRTTGDRTTEQSGGGVWVERRQLSVNDAWRVQVGVVTNCLLVGNSAEFYGGGAINGNLLHCTLSDNSVTYFGGGAHSSDLLDCTLSGNSARLGGGAAECTLSTCTLGGNSADLGGGVRQSTLHHCTLRNNSAASDGGGASESDLFHCTLDHNLATDGGGVSACALDHCLLTNNVADAGGGAHGSTLTNCILWGNAATSAGGGAYAGTLNNCLVANNTVNPLFTGNGGGAYRSSLTNCTVLGNQAWRGGGVANCTNLNSIVYYNTDISFVSPNYLSSTFTYSCTTPLPAGQGNLSADPLFVDQAGSDFHLRHDSPCIDVGADLSASIDTDLEGNPRPRDGDRDGAARFDLGAYEHTPILNVWPDSPNPTPPYADWTTAARTIQDAVDAALADEVVRVTNGVYAAGGRAVYGLMTNRVAIDKPLTVQSVNGPAVTLILGAPAAGGGNGDGAIRCAYVGANAVLSGFTLTNGHTRIAGAEPYERRGGGVWCEESGVVTNCLLVGNSAFQGGGGAFAGTLLDCTLTSNTAETRGGGAFYATLCDCRLTRNVAVEGGGAYGGALTRCTLATNESQGFGGGAFGGTLQDCLLDGNVAARDGGGIFQGTLERCALSGNWAGEDGGGSLGGTLQDCTLSDNTAGYGGGGTARGLLTRCILRHNTAGVLGGGAYYSTLHNCLLTGNRAGNVASGSGGGASRSALTNCTVSGNAARAGGGVVNCTNRYSIVYFNAAFAPLGGANYLSSTFENSCTTPLPAAGAGNLADDPLFADALAGDFRLRAGSPCIDAGSLTKDLDLVGTQRPRNGDQDFQARSDLGAYEFTPRLRSPIQIREERITYSASDHLYPVFCSQGIVFDRRLGGQDDIVLATDPVTSYTIAGGDGNQTSPDADGDLVVYVTDALAGTDIGMADLSTGIHGPLVTVAGSDSQPVVSGENVAYTTSRFGSDDVVMMNRRTYGTTYLATSPAIERDPSIDGNLVAWSVFRNGSWDVQACILGEPVFDVAAGPGNESAPSVQGTRIAYVVERDIALFDVTTGQTIRITDDPYFQGAVQLDGPRIFWADDRCGNFDIFMMDLLEGREYQLTTEPVTQVVGDVAGNQVVFSDQRYGNANVWLLTFTLNHAPVVEAGSDQTVLTGQTVQLAGSVTDPDGDASLLYLWTIESAPVGSTATLSAAHTLTATFRPDRPGTYVLNLLASDGTDTSEPDRLQIRAVGLLVQRQPDGRLAFSWEGQDYILQSALTVTGPWSNHLGQTSPFLVDPQMSPYPAVFYRLASGP